MANIAIELPMEQITEFCDRWQVLRGKTKLTGLDDQRPDLLGA
jgi:hypothetical protein